MLNSSLGTKPVGDIFISTDFMNRQCNILFEYLSHAIQGEHVQLLFFKQIHNSLTLFEIPVNKIAGETLFKTSDMRKGNKSITVNSKSKIVFPNDDPQNNARKHVWLIGG